MRLSSLVVVLLLISPVAFAQHSSGGGSSSGASSNSGGFSQSFRIKFGKLLHQRTLIWRIGVVEQSQFPRIKFARLLQPSARAKPEQSGQPWQQFAAGAERMDRPPASPISETHAESRLCRPGADRL
jgi:hypothetical protein